MADDEDLRKEVVVETERRGHVRLFRKQNGWDLLIAWFVTRITLALSRIWSYKVNLLKRRVRCIVR